MLDRPLYLHQLLAATRRSPVTALLGPRQSGKTTLARLFARDKPVTIFDLESQPDSRRLQNPELVLGSLQGLVVLDEIQAMPELFSVLRVLVDRPDNQAHFLILGSASPAIVKGVSETLAGRVEFIELSGFDLAEVGDENWQSLWVRGGFPRAFLTASDEDSLAWREGFIRTFLERDLPQLGITIPAAAMRRFWTMLAHYHGQTWNASELGRAMSLSDKTVRSYLDILTGAYMVRQLQPWYENIGKRQVKAPKVYLRDAGLLHSLLSIADFHSLLAHPRLGASWEGFVIEQVLRIVKPSQAYFWSTHTGAEVDLFFLHAGGRFGIEIKFNEAPSLTQSMHTSISDLKLDHLWVVYPGQQTYPVHPRITMLPLKALSSLRNSLV
ncbi:MAG: ATP-binding protein [Caldilineales bacterium]|nr:ATP-binding protein [Caldilineales bacterium]